MILECLGSSSAGNCYLLSSAAETLIVECGVNPREVKRALGWTLRGVAACVVSHEHQDHAKHIKDFMRCGIKVLALPEVFASQGIGAQEHYAEAIEPMRPMRAGGFSLLPLPVAHDAPCVAFVIEHAEMGKTLFVTDTMMLEYSVRGLSHIMIEANYSDAILQHNADRGLVPAGLRDRLMRSHMELRTTAEAVRACALESVRDIVLLHLSARNSDPEMFRQAIAEASGKPVHIARKGLKIDFSNNEPY